MTISIIQHLLRKLNSVIWILLSTVLEVEDLIVPVTVWNQLSIMSLTRLIIPSLKKASRRSIWQDFGLYAEREGWTKTNAMVFWCVDQILQAVGYSAPDNWLQSRWLSRWIALLDLRETCLRCWCNITVITMIFTTFYLVVSVLTWVSIFWFSRAGPDVSARIYGEANRANIDIFKVSVPSNVPAGITYYPKELFNFPRR